MPDPVETLNILVEAAVAIAGFSGVVVVFGRRATGEWSELERAFILSLLVSSFTVLFLSLATLLLLHTGITAENTWRIGSGIWCVIAARQILWGARTRYAGREDLQLSTTTLTNYLLNSGTAFFVILNVWNASMSGQFWPFMAAQIWTFGAACWVFAALLIPQRHGEPAAQRSDEADSA